MISVQACYSGKNRFFCYKIKKQNNKIDFAGVVRLQRNSVAGVIRSGKINRYYLLDNIK